MADLLFLLLLLPQGESFLFSLSLWESTFLFSLSPWERAGVRALHASLHFFLTPIRVFSSP
jgi:hypothetical protein